MRLPKYRLFDYNTPGKGVDENEPPKTGIKLFGDILYRRFWKMVSLNLLYMLFSIPAFIITWFMLYVVMTLFFSTIMVDDIQMASSITQICMYLTCVFSALFGTGAPTAAMTYVLRNYREDRHAWVWSDFKEKFFKYLKRGTLTFVIDTVLLFLFGVNFWFYGMYAGSNIAAYILQGLMVVLFLLLLLVHAYIYPIMISFDMGIKDIYKNSFLLAVGKFPITIASIALLVAVSGIVAFLACFVAVYAVLLIPIVLFAFCTFTNLFITYPTIKKYMALSSEDIE